jgi:DNA-binding MarR family transcriptional regulator
MHLKPADLLIAAKLAVSDDPNAPVRELEESLGMSKSTVAKSILRLRALDLVKDDGKGGRRVNRLALRECFEHAVRWLVPARAGKFELGLATAHTSEAMASKLSGDDDPVVMPFPEGPQRGRAVAPIHPAAPQAAASDPKLLRLLAIVDSFRIGGAREREVARAELVACL